MDLPSSHRIITATVVTALLMDARQKIGSVVVTMTHAVHSCGIADGDQILYGGEASGYVLRFEDGRSLYFAGDTNVFSDMQLIEQLYHPELAFLPIGDLFTMSPREAALEHEVRAAYGASPLSAVAVQVEQLRLRLAAFARWQAAHAAEGWRILRVEAQPEEPGAAFVVDGAPMSHRGRIDRIDLREASGELLVLDYKTGDRAKSPEQAHRQGDDWIDLQLPLYRHLLPALGIEGRTKLGYVVLRTSTAAVGLLEAPWSEEDLQSADRTAEEVIRKVRQGSFWPPTRPAPEYFEELAAICGDGPFGAAVVATPDEEEVG